MAAKSVALVAFASIVVGLAGCTTCHHQACAVSLLPATGNETCAGQRNRVHVFLTGGVDVFDDGGLRGLRDAINAAGFSQVHYGHVHHGGWFGREMRRIAREDPHARFVMVGYEVGAKNAAALAADARRHGHHVDGLVLLDPGKLPADDCSPPSYPVYVVGSDRWAPHSELPAGDVTRLPDVCHFSIATDPLTVERTIGLLHEAVGRVPVVMPPPAMPMIDDPAPIPAVIPDPLAAPRSRSPAATLSRRPNPRP